MTNFLIDAEAIARQFHTGQTDKNGIDYIEHPQRVAAKVASPEAKAVAWLHDVIEDTEMTAAGLIEAGIPVAVVEAVELLTRTPEISNDVYYEYIRGNSLALEVKLADIADNTDPARVALLDKSTQERLATKYEKALASLTRG